MTRLLDRLDATRRLGAANVARVGSYQLLLKSGLHPVQRLTGTVPQGPFFLGASSPPSDGAVARQDWQADGRWFGVHRFSVDGPPDWHLNPFTSARADASAHWWDLPDFDPALGDIKAVWEASRFDWLIAMAQRAALGEAASLQRLNDWLADWVTNNPPYRGVNWKCGQEASIRLLHLALTAQWLEAGPGFEPLLRLHLQRIEPTLGYAIGQANNHGTSEAAALFVGGLLLGDERLAAKGRYWLDERAFALITDDGGFSQYSHVYHRMMLGTYAFAETIRRHLNALPFTDRTYDRLRAATHWLAALVDPASGDGPNLGANDGSNILDLLGDDGRDFRPALQWAAALFLTERAIAQSGPWDQPLHWLSIPNPTDQMAIPANRSCDRFGLHVIRVGSNRLFFRTAGRDFRPGQADMLHVDLWVEGENLLRDAGSYSYASSDQDEFAGIAAHNSIQFDGREPMPRVSRFLHSHWPKAERVEQFDREVHADYHTHFGARHRRAVQLEERLMTCVDWFDGNAREAVLRWRLPTGDWRIEGQAVTDGRRTLSIKGAADIRLTEGRESRHYLQGDPVTVVEAPASVPGKLETELRF